MNVHRHHPLMAVRRASWQAWGPARRRPRHRSHLDGGGMAMTPYYSDDHVQLWHGDCREITAWLEADVLVTDPPYGADYISARVPGRRVAIEGDGDTSLRDHVLGMWGIRPALAFGRWDIPKPAGVVMRLVWDKMLLGTGDLRCPWGRSDEEMYVLGNWPPVVPGGRLREGGTPSRHSSVIRVQALPPGHRDRPNHPTPKPVPLMEQLIAKCPQGVIADPFAGAGATLIAAKLQGRQAIGVEIDERYAEIAARRLAQDSLFGEAS